MGNLSDFFPDSFRTDYSERSLEVGTVIRCFVTDIESPKEKFWIIIGINQERGELLSIYVNTRPAPFIQRNPVLLQAQLLLSHSGREIFNYDCFADCCHPKVKGLNDIQELLRDNPNYIKGKLTYEEIKQIRILVKESKNVAVITKKRFGIF